MRWTRLIGGLTLLLALAVPAGASAAFPGANGKINFCSSGSRSGCFFMNPDGGGVTPATSVSGFSIRGIWSPDASHFLQSCNNAVCVFRSNGTLEQENYYAAAVNGMGWSPDGTKLVHAEQPCGAETCDPEKIAYQGFPSGPGADVTAQDDLEPAWSPDGTKIAFVSFRNDPRGLFFGGPPPAPGSTELYVSNVDGTGQLRLTNSSGSEGGPTQTGIDDNDGESLPSWSPDGTKIAVASNRDGNWEIYVVNADGSGAQRLTNNPATDLRPRWSPDGTKIAFQTNRDGNWEIYSMNPNGTGQTNLTNNSADDVLYDWLSIPITSYPRPRGATPVNIALVPAYAQCTSPNRTHGASLSFGSCAPPTQTSGQLTVGTPDANGQGAKLYSKILYGVGGGDVGVIATITDVRRKSDLSDYTGELSLAPGLRITDKNNTPNPGGPGAGTVQDTTLPITIPCAATADTTIGSTCNLSTTVNAVYPGAVVPGKRAIWQFGPVRVYDGGADGLASTVADNTLFLDQGVFVP
jgi:hypothetical protein